MSSMSGRMLPTVRLGVARFSTVTKMSSASVSSMTGLPDGAAPRGRVIHLQLTSAASGTAIGVLKGMVRLTFPVDASTTDVVGYYQVESGGSLEAMGFDHIDPASHAISFRTRAPGLTGAVSPASSASAAASPGPQAQGVRILASTTTLLASYVAVGVSQVTLTRMASTQSVIDSGFRPSANGFSLPNFGSAYEGSSGGNCFGMVGFAKYYYQMAYPSPLADTYRDAQKSATWIDDAVGIELASREQKLMTDIWATYSQELDLQSMSSTDVAYSLLGAIYVTGKPALVGLWRVVNNQTAEDSHAVSVWRASVHADGGIAFATYDPNFAKDDARTITWNRAGGFDNYVSGDNSASAEQTYNGFEQMAMAVGLTPDQLARDKADADRRVRLKAQPGGLEAAARAGLTAVRSAES